MASQALVIAGAGTGKTEVLLGRLRSLIDREKLTPGSEAIVLSYTRAAVGEIRERLSDSGGNARYATVRTFDSFATLLLANFATDEDWEESDYDGRIEKAIELIQSDTETRDFLGAYRHIFVDELQDLVGVRNRFVQANLTATSAGFTLLGDPAQAIYDWQLRTNNIKESSIFDWLENQYNGELQTFRISQNHRRIKTNHKATTEHTIRISDIGKALGESDPDYPVIGDQISIASAELPALAGPEGAKPVLMRPKNPPTAVLCRRNSEALVICGAFHELGIKHHMRRRATDTILPDWIARTIGGFDATSMGKKSFCKQYETRVDSINLSCDQAWKSLKKMGSSQKNALDIPALRERVLQRWIPDELTQSPTVDVIVSTIHRAKGLEFDSVVILEPKPFHKSKDRDLLIEEIKTLYVAMTRPRRYLMRLDEYEKEVRNASGSVFHCKWTDRCVRAGPQHGWKLFGFELKGGDVEQSAPAGARHIEEDAWEIQEYLWQSVHPGDSVELRFLPPKGNEDARPIYAVVHEGRPIGITSEWFGMMLRKKVTGRKKEFPVRIDDLRIECVESVAGTPAAAQNTGVGASGFWLTPRLTGLGKVHWSN
jgi:superfamily I DNA/RNA helicase